MDASPNPGDMPHEKPSWSAASFASASLDATVRRSLARLDARRATPTQVRDALAAAGVRVSITWAQEWLEERRACR